MINLNLPLGCLFKFVINEHKIEVSDFYHVLTDDQGVKVNIFIPKNKGDILKDPAFF